MKARVFNEQARRQRCGVKFLVRRDKGNAREPGGKPLCVQFGDCGKLHSVIGTQCMMLGKEGRCRKQRRCDLDEKVLARQFVAELGQYCRCIRRGNGFFASHATLGAVLTSVEKITVPHKPVDGGLS
jgi:hypothetical protein